MNWRIKYLLSSLLSVLLYFGGLYIVGFIAFHAGHQQRYDEGYHNAVDSIVHQYPYMLGNKEEIE